MENKKYKDDLPINTVNKIKKILNSTGLYPKEVMWNNS